MMKALGVADDLEQTTDEVLLSRYRDEGRTADFDALVHRYERELYRYLARYTGDAAPGGGRVPEHLPPGASQTRAVRGRPAGPTLALFDRDSSGRRRPPQGRASPDD